MNKKDEVSILYVEDQDDVRLFLSKILSRHYSQVFLAENGKEGLDFFIDNRPDIIISDIKMPVMDGLSMSARIKEIDPGAKIILTTAHSDMEYFLHSIDIGINHYILKPIDRDKLFLAIDSCARQVLLEREVEKKKQELIKTNEKLVSQERQLRENLQKTIALKEIVSKSEENFRQLAENIEDAFWLCESRKVLYVNQAFERIFGIPLKDFYENIYTLLDAVHPEDKEAFRSIIDRKDCAAQPGIQKEFRIINSDGKIRNIWYRDTFFNRDENNKNLRRAATISDITQKNAYEKLQQEYRVSAQLAKLKRKFLTNVSHEMRTPLNGIVSMTDILLNTSLDPKQEEYTRVIHEAGHNLMGMINDLLDLNELEAGRKELTIDEIQTSRFTEKLYRYFQPLASQKGLSFRIEISPEVPDMFRSDSGQLFQLCRHLIANAVKFTQKGEIALVLRCIATDNSAAKLIIEVSDTGIGIQREDLDMIFQLFSQKDESLARSFEGLGLGLTLSKRIVNLLNGTLEAESTPGEGSIFRVAFSTSKVPDAIQTPSPFFANIPQLNARVLYAEDKVVNQRIISIMLENAGCKVQIAENGQQAIEMFTKNKHDIILMDIQMPVMDGITAAKHLKSNFNDLPPVIGISANALMAEADYYIAQGLDDYMSKPVEAGLLYSKLAYWLNKSKAGISVPENIPHSTPAPVEKETPDGSEIIILDETVIDELLKQTQNNLEIVAELYKTFLEESEVLVSKIKASTADSDKKLLRESTHALKGLSATIGADRLYKHLTVMDSMYKKDDFEHVQSLTRKLEEDFAMVSERIKEQFDL